MRELRTASLTEDQIQQRMARIPKRLEEISSVSPGVSEVIEDSLRKNMRLSQAELFQHAMRYASINYKDFYEYLKQNHSEDPLELEYVSPGAVTLAAGQNVACLAIGIGVVWIWVVVSPWTTESPN